MLKYLTARNEDIPAGTAALYFGFSSILWFVIGTGLGSFNAAKLAFPDFVTGSEMFAFGHMRQVHVLAVIFGWISMAFAMAALRASGEIVIEDCDNVRTSFPNFLELARGVGLGVAQEE